KPTNDTSLPHFEVKQTLIEHAAHVGSGPVSRLIGGAERRSVVPHRRRGWSCRAAMLKKPLAQVRS
ncbi:MAG: hypothetical protein ACM3Q0_04180, partial [Bacteroidota bacterium]